MAGRTGGSRRGGGATGPAPAPRLELAEDQDFQRRNWRFERVAWGVMTLFLIAAAIGLFGGGGPLGREVAGKVGGPLWVDHPRFGRAGLADAIHVHLGAGASRDREAGLWVDRRLLDALAIERITPEPERSEAGAEGTLFVFAKHDPARPAAITLRVVPDRSGRVSGRMGLPGGDAVSLSLFIHP